MTGAIKCSVISTNGRDLKNQNNKITKRTLTMNKTYYVYLITNWNNKVLYIGVTNNLERRLYEHKNKLIKGFTEKYNINKLVYFEQTNDIESAIIREKEIKKWRREKKNSLVESANKQWEDLSKQWQP
jgi:putative endonuclease